MSKTSFYIKICGEQVLVDEDIYRAFMRPVWTEQKRQAIRAERERSLELFAREGFEPSSDDLPVEMFVMDKLQVDKLRSALYTLSDGERDLIDALFFKGESERSIAQKVGLSKTGVHKQKVLILEKLKNLLS